MKNIIEPFFIVPSKVFSLGLSPYELSVLFYLCMRADNENYTCWPSINGIKMGCGASVSTIKRALYSLEQKKLIKIIPQYQTTAKGFNRQTANLYRIMLFENSPQGVSEPARIPVGTPPQFSQTWEINKTKSNITKSNITKSSELSLADAEEVEKERLSFLKLKRDCFEKLEKELMVDREYCLLADRALDSLWHKKSISNEGKEYEKSEVHKLIISMLSAELLRDVLRGLENSAEPIRSPVAYLSTCIFSALVTNELGKIKEKRSSNCSSFDLDEFFEAALRNTYGDKLFEKNTTDIK